VFYLLANHPVVAHVAETRSDRKGQEKDKTIDTLFILSDFIEM
jgi:hypothetical protein